MMARARHTDPSTSHEAAASLQNITVMQRRVLGIVAAHGPLTDNMVAMEYDFGFSQYASPSGLRTRRVELVRQGLVEDSGLKRTLPSGRRSICWRVTDAGLEKLG